MDEWTEMGIPGWHCGKCGGTSYEMSPVLMPEDGGEAAKLYIRCRECGHVSEFRYRDDTEYGPAFVNEDFLKEK